MDGRKNAAGAGACIEQALQDRTLKSKAREFAARHAGFDPARVIEEAANILRDALRNPTSAANRTAVS